MALLGKALRLATYLLGVLFILVVVYGVGRLIHVAQGSVYHGERSPYLQMAAAEAMTVRWQSLTNYRGVIKYGVQANTLTGTAIETESRQSHEIRLTGLQPATRYYYAVGAVDGELKADAEHWFVTSPRKGTDQSVRFLVLGDPGLAIPGQVSVRDAALNWLHSNRRPNRADLDIVLTTGDNAYSSGRNEEFQQNFFEPFKTILRNIPVWPIYGNHDARRWAFFEIFSFPTHGESGGVASGTEHYYSFDYGQVHFVVLDSEDSRWNNNRAMVDWLKLDLQANQQPWLIALFHHPPYSKGSHNSDSEGDSRGRMFDMRENVIPILEQHGVDLIMSGHSHMYERSYLLDCHYGTSDTLQAGMILSRDKQQYQKRSPGAGAHEGAIYAVVGSSARSDYGPINHPVMANSMLETGSLIVDVKGQRLEGWFVSGTGKVLDQFSITKGVATAPTGQCAK